MSIDERLGSLLTQAAGPEPRGQDYDDVRRRARRLHRRRRAGVVAAAVAVVGPGLFAAARLQPDDGESLQAGGTTSSTPSTPAPTTTAPPVEPGTLLFERALAGGATLRVTAGPSEGLVDIAWEGHDATLRINPTDGGDLSGGALYNHSFVATDNLALGLGYTVGAGDRRWEVWSVAACPIYSATGARLIRADGETADEMDFVDGLAVVVVPLAPGEDPNGLMLAIPGWDSGDDEAHEYGPGDELPSLSQTALQCGDGEQP